MTETRGLRQHGLLWVQHNRFQGYVLGNEVEINALTQLLIPNTMVRSISVYDVESDVKVDSWNYTRLKEVRSTMKGTSLTVEEVRGWVADDLEAVADDPPFEYGDSVEEISRIYYAAAEIARDGRDDT